MPNEYRLLFYLLFAFVGHKELIICKHLRIAEYLFPPNRFPAPGFFVPHYRSGNSCSQSSLILCVSSLATEPIVACFILCTNKRTQSCSVYRRVTYTNTCMRRRRRSASLNVHIRPSCRLF